MKNRRRAGAALFVCLGLVAGSFSACGNSFRAVGNIDSIQEVSTEITSPKGNDYKVTTEEVEMEKAQLRDRVMGG